MAQFTGHRPRYLWQADPCRLLGAQAGYRQDISRQHVAVVEAENEIGLSGLIRPIHSSVLGSSGVTAVMPLSLQRRTEPNHIYLRRAVLMVKTIWHLETMRRELLDPDHPCCGGTTAFWILRMVYGGRF